MLGFLSQTLGKLFGTDKAAEALVNNTASALDKLIYTSEEKAEAEAADRSAARAMIIEWMRTTSGQNIARRLLALMITGTWLFQYLILVVLSCLAPWLKTPDNVLETVKILGSYTEQMNGAVMLILAFYFAAPHMGSIVQGALSKFGKQTP